jgi:hypothetical protein
VAKKSHIPTFILQKYYSLYLYNTIESDFSSKSIFLLIKIHITMDSTTITEIIAYTLPSLITGGVAYLLFNSHFKDQQNTRRWLLQKDNQAASLPLRLQAYERMTLFMERINPSQLLVRITPLSDDKNDYRNFVIAQIEQEFEHNLTQQIYISDECWSIIVTAKNATIQMVRLAAKNEKVTDANSLRETIISDLLEKPSPSSAALAFIKNEVSQLW